MDKNRKIKTAIIVLSVFLIISIIALAASLIYNHCVLKDPVSVVVPENVITPEELTSDAANTQGESPDGGSASSGSDNSDNIVAKSLFFYKKATRYNEPFNVGNMFPGDRIVNKYCVKVAYNNRITIDFHVNIEPGYEKLAQVLKIKVKILDTNTVLYDGIMRDIPETLEYRLPDTETPLTGEANYEITSYLDKSIGNEYMNQSLKADFVWWAEETQNLVYLPQTGAGSYIYIWIAVMLVAAAVIIILFFRKTDEKEDEQYE